MPSKSAKSRVVVTLDGLAGSGKSSLAAALAKELGFLNFNSGLLYRTIGYLALTEAVSVDDEQGLAAMVARHRIQLVVDERDNDAIAINLDGATLNADLRAPAVSEATSRSSRFAAVRSQLLALQREAYPGRNLVAEGRDMGSVVFPEAQVKFFVEASVAVRVTRRIEQLAAQSGTITRAELEAQISREITERDARDAGRSVAPTVAAAGAIIIDNSTLPLRETVAKMAAIVRSKVMELS